MKLLVRYSFWLSLLAIVSVAVRAESAFNIRLEGVKFDYPGGEQWAEIERPDGQHIWAFAIYTGQGNWTIPFREEVAGKYRILRIERRAGDKKSDVTIAKDSQMILELKAAQKISKPAPQQKPLVGAGEFTTFFTAEEPWCVNDHTFIQGPDKTWHLFGITHPKPLSWEKDPGHQLAHATAKTLLQAP